MDQHLHKVLVDGEVILSDRVLPGTQGNIDFVVVASSGIWVIDAKKWQGLIEMKPTSRLAATMDLFVDKVKKTPEIDRIYNLVIPIRQLVTDRSVPIEPALVFMEGNWSTRSSLHLQLKGPYREGKVWIGGATTVTNKIKEPGALSADHVARLGKHLDQALPPR
jgi:hypothetical protein